MRYYFTSDTHFCHKGIINFCDRPFIDVEDMNNKLIDNWNSRVKKNDTVFHLGDFGFGSRKVLSEIFNKLNGNKILLQGNHDKHNGFRTIILDMGIYYGKKNILLIHRPEDIGYTGYTMALCGHVHNAWKFKEFKIFENTIDVCNVSVDVWNYYPVTISEILGEYGEWKKRKNIVAGIEERNNIVAAL